jgi:glutathione S-transferase
LSLAPLGIRVKVTGAIGKGSIAASRVCAARDPFQVFCDLSLANRHTATRTSNILQPRSTTLSNRQGAITMHYVALVTVLALFEFCWLIVRVGKARATYGVNAPATSGHDIFDRHFRVQMNTIEQLVLFLPSLWIFAAYVSPLWAACLGLVFILGRAIYAVTYVRDPRSRSLGFALTALPTLTMLVGIAMWAIRAAIVIAAQ